MAPWRHDQFRVGEPIRRRDGGRSDDRGRVGRDRHHHRLDGEGTRDRVDTLTGGAGGGGNPGLGKGDVVDFAGRPALRRSTRTAGNIAVTLGGGPATVYGGLGDTVNFGSVSQYADGTAGNQKIAVGSGGTDIIIGSTLAAAGTGVDTLTGGAGVAEIQGLGKGDVVDFAAQTGNATINAIAGNIRVTLGGGPATVYGGAGDTINFGSAGQYADGTAGGQTIAVGSGGTDLVIGSMVSSAGGHHHRRSAALDYNPGAGAGDDLVNLAGSSGAATVNAVGADTGPVNDTVIASNGGDSVWAERATDRRRRERQPAPTSSPTRRRSRAPRSSSRHQRCGGRGDLWQLGRRRHREQRRPRRLRGPGVGRRVRGKQGDADRFSSSIRANPQAPARQSSRPRRKSSSTARQAPSSPCPTAPK